MSFASSSFDSAMIYSVRFFTLFRFLCIIFLMNCSIFLEESWALFLNYIGWCQIKEIRFTVSSLQTIGKTAIVRFSIWIRILLFFKDVTWHGLAFLMEIVFKKLLVFVFMRCGLKVVANAECCVLNVVLFFGCFVVLSHFSQLLLLWSL